MKTNLISIEALDDSIVQISHKINAATCELLVLIREFDERAGWLKWGLHNCAEWLAWRCDYSIATAREKVRVAHALKALPRVTAAFRAGELSYTKVRSMTRVANHDNESDLLEFALRHTAVHVAEHCLELRMGSANSTSAAERAFSNRNLRLKRDAERGVVTMTVELPLEAGDLVDKALDKARNDDVLAVADIVDTSWSKRQADAFVGMLKEYLNGDAKTGRSDNYLVTVHVDEKALRGESGRSSLPVETARRLCCDGSTLPLIENDKGEPLSIGRKSRVVPTAIERAVRARDKNCCRFPGCRNRRFTECHHVEHWSNNGETAEKNLLLLCTKHHTLVHEGGFRIEKDFKDEWYFVRPDGVAVPDVGYRSQDMIDADLGEEWDPPAGGFLPKLENMVGEPPHPVYVH